MDLIQYIALTIVGTILCAFVGVALYFSTYESRTEDFDGYDQTKIYVEEVKKLPSTDETKDFLRQVGKSLDDDFLSINEFNIIKSKYNKVKSELESKELKAIL